MGLRKLRFRLSEKSQEDNMQTRPSHLKKKNVPTILVVVPLVIIGLAVFLLILSWFISRMGFKSIETREDVSEKPLPKTKKYHVNLYIQSNVGGADVYVNGEKQELGTRSSDLKASVFGLRPGTYEIWLKKEFYKDIVRKVELTGDKAAETVIMEMAPLK
jgi:hypothetical protein